MKETWVAGPQKHRRERAPKMHRIDWGWVLFIILYTAVGLAVLYGVLYLMEGR